MPAKWRKNFVLWACGWILLAVTHSSARGDGGTVRISRDIGNWKVTVLTAPTPLVCGSLDVSVCVQDLATGRIIPDAKVKVRLMPTGPKGMQQSRWATQEHSTNKLYRSAIFVVATPGEVQIEAEVEQGARTAALECLAMVGPQSPGLSSLWIWIGWPILPIGLYIAVEIVRLRKLTTRPVAATLVVGSGYDQ